MLVIAKVAKKWALHDGANGVRFECMISGTTFRERDLTFQVHATALVMSRADQAGGMKGARQDRRGVIAAKNCWYYLNVGIELFNLSFLFDSAMCHQRR